MKINISDEQIEYGTHSNNVLDQAKNKNMRVVFPDEYTLQLDIDDAAEFATYQRMLPFFKDFIPVVEVIDKPSKSGGAFHRHISIRLDQKVTELERIILQLTLGSDPKREMFAFIRINCGDPHSSIFLEPKEE